MDVNDRESPDLAFVCDAEGAILELLRDDFGFDLSRGDHLEIRMETEERVKFGRFLGTVAARRVAFNWLLHLRSGERVETLHFAGARVGDDLTVVAARDRAALMRLGREISGLGTESAGARSRIPQQEIPGMEAREDRDSLLFDELSRLNNELSTTQRQLIKSNHQLVLANQQLQAFYEALPVGVVHTDLRGCIIEANERFHAITGTRPGESWLETVHPEDRPQVEADWNDARESMKALGIRCRRLTADGSTREMELQWTPLRDDKDQALGFAGVVEDVSAETRIVRQERQLERQADLQALTAGLAHNLNNIMTVILGAAEELETDLPSDDPLRETVSFGLEAVQRATRLVDGLVVYSGSAALTTEPVAIDATLAAICERKRGRLPAGVELVTDFQAASTTASLADSLFEESIDELLTNASRAVAPRGRIEVATRRTEDAADRPRVCVTITDNGVGMDAETLQRIRDPFFTTREVGQGVGLGLSLVDGFARHSHGSLEIDSQQGVGTRVELCFPALDAAESARSLEH